MKIPIKKETVIRYSILLVIAVSLLVVYLVVFSSSGLDNFASCLKSEGVVLYTSEGCSHCKKQKEMLGSSIERLTHIDCAKDATACNENNIERVPTWVFGEKRVEGVLEFKTISELSGCQIGK